jgi:hypothetical protein
VRLGLTRAVCAAQSDGAALQWAYDMFGTVLTHSCGTGSCLNESSYLAEEIQSATCATSYAHKVTLVLDGGNINDGTFNQLAYEGAVAGCTAALSCCLEVDHEDQTRDRALPMAAPAGCCCLLLLRAAAAATAVAPGLLQAASASCWPLPAAVL